MTKHIRIENADLSNYKVNVFIQDKQYNPDTLLWDGNWLTTEKLNLDMPTQLITHYITEGRRIVIEEAGTSR